MLILLYFAREKDVLICLWKSVVMKFKQSLVTKIFIHFCVILLYHYLTAIPFRGWIFWLLVFQTRPFKTL